MRGNLPKRGSCLPHSSLGGLKRAVKVSAVTENGVNSTPLLIAYCFLQQELLDLVKKIVIIK